MKRSGVETQVVAERFEDFSVGEEEPNGADVAVLGAPLDERHLILVFGGCGVARG